MNYAAKIINLKKLFFRKVEFPTKDFLIFILASSFIFCFMLVTIYHYRESQLINQIEQQNRDFVLLKEKSKTGQTIASGDNCISLKEVISTVEELTKEKINQSNNAIVLGTTLPTLSPTTTPSVAAFLGTVMTTGSPASDIYDLPQTGSSIILTPPSGTIYFYYEKNTDWYRIEIETGKFAWIQASQTIEFPQNATL